MASVMKDVSNLEASSVARKNVERRGLCDGLCADYVCLNSAAGKRNLGGENAFIRLAYGQVSRTSS